MKLCSLDAENLLSFDQFHLEFDDRLTVLVGPNGAGKSNVARLLDLASTAVSWADERWSRTAEATVIERVLAGYAEARHRGAADAVPARVRVSIELTADRERERVVAFMQAAILSTLLGERAGNADDGRLAAWVSEHVVAGTLTPLLGRGTIVVEHFGVPDAPWEVAYEFACGGAAYRWVLTRQPFGGLVRADGGAASIATLLPSQPLGEALFGITSSGGPLPSLPDPLPPFALETLCPPADRTVQVNVGGSAAGRLQLDLPPYRRFADLNRVPVAPRAPDRVYSLARPLRLALDDALVMLGEQPRGVGSGGVQASPAGWYRWNELSSPPPRREPYALPLRLFALKNGTAAERERYRHIQATFSELAPGRTVDIQFRAEALPTGLPPAPGGSSIVAARVRAPSPEPAIDALNFSPVGFVPSTREASETAEPAAEVSVLIGETTPNTDDNGEWELPIFVAGAGIWEALVVAEAMTDNEDRVVVLDEPALNLHPTWQHVLRSRFVSNTGQVVVTTHSPHLVPMSDDADLPRVVRLDVASGATRAYRLGRSADRAMASKVAKEFGLSADARALLFARGAILVEGQTELGALPLWFAQSAPHRDRTPDALDLAFHYVGGDRNFGTHLTLLRALAIPWVVICDGAVFDVVESRGWHIFRQLRDAGVNASELDEFLMRHVQRARPRSMTVGLLTEELALAQSHGVFTLARGWTRADRKVGSAGDESFEAFLESVAPGQLATAEKDVGDSKVRQGRWVAEAVSPLCQDSVRHPPTGNR